MIEFKNNFERLCYHACLRVFSDENTVRVEHNTKISADFSFEHGVISFTGSPNKEVDVISYLKIPKHHSIIIANDYRLLVSCKFHKSKKVKSPPTHIQEWGNILKILNIYSKKAKYLGLVISSTGFTSGCGAWAIANNIGIIPPYKGKSLSYKEKDILNMYDRVLKVTKRTIERGSQDLLGNSNFYWHVYKAVSDFED